MPTDPMAARRLFEKEYFTAESPHRPYIFSVGCRTTRPCIVVLLKQELPPELALPDSYEGVPVESHTHKPFLAQAN